VWGGGRASALGHWVSGPALISRYDPALVSKHEPALVGEVGQPVSRSKPAQVSTAASVVMCELVLAVVVTLPRVFAVDPARLDWSHGVVNPWHTRCALVTRGQRVRKKCSVKIRDRPM